MTTPMSTPGPLAPTRTVTFSSSGGTTLYGEWFAPTSPRGVVIVLHGYAEHCGRYRELANVLVRSGLAVLTPTADGFTVTVTRAASGPDAGAAFAGAGTHAASGTRQAVSASEPFTAAMTLAGLVSAGLLSRRRRV